VAPVDGREAGRERALGGRDPLAPWAGVLLGGSAGIGAVTGLGVELSGSSTGHRNVAVAASLATVLTVVGLCLRLRMRLRYPTPWDLFVPLRWLAAALLAAVAPVLLPGSWFLASMLAAAALVVIALFTMDVAVAARLLAGAALAGLGVTFTSVWAVRDGTVPANAAFIGLGVAFTGLAAAVLYAGSSLAAAAMAGLGTAVTGGGALLLLQGKVAPGSALITAIGAGFLVGGVVMLVRFQGIPAGTVVGDMWAELGGIGAAAFIVGVCLPIAPDGDLLGGTAMIGLGLAFIGAGAEPFGE
jgi:hypothetical protein